MTETNKEKNFWESYMKPPSHELKKVLSGEAYSVTQEDGTERPFTSDLNENKNAGIYVDILSGEPLFLLLINSNQVQDGHLL